MFRLVRVKRNKVRDFLFASFDGVDLSKRGLLLLDVMACPLNKTKTEKTPKRVKEKKRVKEETAAV